MHKHQKVLASHGIALSVLLVASIFTLSVKGADIAALVAAATSSVANSPTTLYLTPYGDTTLALGETMQVDVNVNARVPINAIGTTVTFPVDSLEIVGISKKKSFLALWTEETAINEEKGEVHFSGGTLQKGGLMGTGTALTITVRAKKAGDASLDFKGAELFGADGKGTLLESDTHPLTFAIASQKEIEAVAVNTTPSEEGAAPQGPSPDLNGDGKINLVDVSMEALHIFTWYNARYDLNSDGAITIADISVIFANFKI